MAVLAEPKDRRTVKAAARCLKASVSGPPPATANSCLNSSIETWLFPDPLVPNKTQLYIGVFKKMIRNTLLTVILIQLT